jgi:hypothetical protein
MALSPTTVSKIIQNGKSVAGAVVNYGGAAVAIGSAAALIYQIKNLQPPKSAGIVMPTTVSFPDDLIDGTPGGRQYYFQMSFAKYQRRSIFDQPFLVPTNGLLLPIPNGLVDTQSVVYGEEGADSAVGAGMEQMSVGGNSGGLSGAINAIKSIGSGAILQSAQNTLNTIQQNTKVNLPLQQLLQLGGVAQNPFLTVLFKSPTFKQHQFSWKLAPNNENETTKLKQIIETIRYNMLPAMAPSTGGTLLTYPNIALIQLMPNDQYLYKFKPCVVESMSVNFAPAPTPAFFNTTDAPVEVHLSLQLKEIEYWLQEDVANMITGINYRQTNFNSNQFLPNTGQNTLNANGNYQNPTGETFLPTFMPGA